VTGEWNRRKGRSWRVRRFVDRAGQSWDVIVGRESWGVHYALFVPASGQREVRQAVLRAASFEEATAEVDGSGDAQLQDLLDASTTKEG